MSDAEMEALYRGIMKGHLGNKGTEVLGEQLAEAGKALDSGELVKWVIGSDPDDNDMHVSYYQIKGGGSKGNQHVLCLHGPVIDGRLPITGPVILTGLPAEATPHTLKAGFEYGLNNPKHWESMDAIIFLLEEIADAIPIPAKP